MRAMMILHAAVIAQMWLIAGILIYTQHMLFEAVLIAAVGAVLASMWWLEYGDRWRWILRRNP